jgi:predicted nuclease of predicted toxin-antitoxin system
VKLLFDQNLSRSLVGRLRDVYPESAHVRELDLATADDAAVWDYARSRGFIIVSKDSDFHERGETPD